MPNPPLYSFESVDLIKLYQSCHPISHTILSVIIGQATPKIPYLTPLLPAESHRRYPIPLRTASKGWIFPHLINHNILSVTLLHASRSNHTPLASSDPISLSAHALLTPSLLLKGGLRPPFLLLLPIYTLSHSLTIRSTYASYFNSIRFGFPLNFPGTPP